MCKLGRLTSSIALAAISGKLRCGVKQERVSLPFVVLVMSSRLHLDVKLNDIREHDYEHYYQFLSLLSV